VLFIAIGIAIAIGIEISSACRILSQSRKADKEVRLQNRRSKKSEVKGDHTARTLAIIRQKVLSADGGKCGLHRYR